MDRIFQKNADRLYPDSQETYRLKKTFFNVLAYIQENDWQGACHASTAVMFVLLKEQGIEATPFIGEVSKVPIVFDHSWIEVDAKVIDAAILNTLVQGVNYPPVLLGNDLYTGEKTELLYGTDKGRGLDVQAEFIAKMPIGQYMEGFTGHPEGLWGISKLLVQCTNIVLKIAVRMSVDHIGVIFENCRGHRRYEQVMQVTAHSISLKSCYRHALNLFVPSLHTLERYLHPKVGREYPKIIAALHQLLRDREHMHLCTAGRRREPCASLKNPHIPNPQISTESVSRLITQFIINVWLIR